MITDLNAVKILNAEKRREAARASAEKYKAQQDADAVNGWNTFIAKHTGAKAVRDQIVFFDCVANRDALELFLSVEEIGLNAETLEFAYRECRPQLAKTPTQQYERKARFENGKLPQQRSFLPPEKAAPYLRSELLAMGPSQLRAAVKKYGIKGINAILAAQN